MAFFDQAEYEVRFEWGAAGLDALVDDADVVVIVDILSFSTCVDVAVGRGARVLPCLWRGESASDYAKTHDALLAGRRGDGGYSLSPKSLQSLPEGTRLVLPSPNGSELSLRARGRARILAGCLRNRTAVAAAARELGERIAVIACGERWPDGSLRPALEDLLGAGSVIDALGESRSPEACAARDTWHAHRDSLSETLRTCSSGRELVERGFHADVELAAELDASRAVPELEGDAYTDSRGPFAMPSSQDSTGSRRSGSDL